MEKFNIKANWAIYVDKEENIGRVKDIIKIMDKDEFENYLPSDLIKPMSDFWKLGYTGKFTDIDLGILQKLCFNEWIFIFCLETEWFDSGKYSIDYYKDKE